MAFSFISVLFIIVRVWIIKEYSNHKIVSVATLPLHIVQSSRKDDIIVKHL